MKQLLTGALVLTGCATTRPSTIPEDPAYIVRATPESRIALRQAVERSLETVAITLDDDALTHDSVLVVDRAEHRDLGPSVMQGRDPHQPGISERFHLVRVLDHCVLVHDRTGRHFDLQGTMCAPM